MLLFLPYQMESTDKERANSDFWFQRCTILIRSCHPIFILLLIDQHSCGKMVLISADSNHLIGYSVLENAVIDFELILKFPPQSYFR